jgi:hypothetical protein
MSDTAYFGCLKNLTNMQKLKVFTGPLLLCAVLLATSCSKDDETPSRKAILTAKAWKISKVEVKVNGTTSDFTVFFLEDCNKDNSFTFQENGTYKDDVGTDDCDGDEANSTGTWSLSSDEKTLTITTDGDAETWNINSIDSNKIVIESPETTDDIDGDGDEETGSMIFTVVPK